MSSSMALRCLLRQIPGRHLPRVGRYGRPMSTVSQDEVRRVAEMHERLMESAKVTREASTRELIKAEKEYQEARGPMLASLHGLIRAVENKRKATDALEVALLRFTGLCLLSAVGIDYYYTDE